MNTKKKQSRVRNEWDVEYKQLENWLKQYITQMKDKGLGDPNAFFQRLKDHISKFETE